MKLFRRYLPVVMGFLILLLILVLGLLRAGYFLSSPAGPPLKADVILALGGDNGDRITMAAKLYSQGLAPRIMLTGLENGLGQTRPDYLNWRVQFLFAQQVPKGAIIIEPDAVNSWEEAINTLSLLKQHKWQRVLVVSDPPHMRRLSWVWGKVFEGSGKEFTLVSTTPIWWEPAHWWRHEQSESFVLMEYIKLVYYMLKY